MPFQILLILLLLTPVSAMHEEGYIADHQFIAHFRQHYRVDIESKKKELGTSWDAIAFFAYLDESRKILGDKLYTGLVLGASLGYGFEEGVVDTKVTDIKTSSKSSKPTITTSEMDIFKNALAAAAQYMEETKIAPENIWSKAGNNVKSTHAKELQSFINGMKKKANPVYYYEPPKAVEYKVKHFINDAKYYKQNPFEMWQINELSKFDKVPPNQFKKKPFDSDDDDDDDLKKILELSRKERIQEFEEAVSIIRQGHYNKLLDNVLYFHKKSDSDKFTFAIENFVINFSKMNKDLKDFVNERFKEIDSNDEGAIYEFVNEFATLDQVKAWMDAYDLQLKQGKMQHGNAERDEQIQKVGKALQVIKDKYGDNYKQLVNDEDKGGILLKLADKDNPDPLTIDIENFIINFAEMSEELKDFVSDRFKEIDNQSRNAVSGFVAEYPTIDQAEQYMEAYKLSLDDNSSGVDKSEAEAKTVLSAFEIIAAKYYNTAEINKLQNELTKSEEALANLVDLIALLENKKLSVDNMKIALNDFLTIDELNKINDQQLSSEISKKLAGTRNSLAYEVRVIRQTLEDEKTKLGKVPDSAQQVYNYLSAQNKQLAHMTIIEILDKHGML